MHKNLIFKRKKIVSRAKFAYINTHHYLEKVTFEEISAIERYLNHNPGESASTYKKNLYS